MTCAQIAAVGLHLVSAHSLDSYNDINPGVYVVAECGVTAGVYYNSQRRVTAYVGYTFEDDDFPIWGSVAVATGYGWDGQPTRLLTPLAMIGLKRRVGDNATARIGYIPRIGRWNDTHVVHLMLEIKL